MKTYFYDIEMSDKQTICEKSNMCNGQESIQDPDNKNDVLLENLANWISCICIVTFDLELGQAIEV